MATNEYLPSFITVWTIWNAEHTPIGVVVCEGGMQNMHQYDQWSSIYYVIWLQYNIPKLQSVADHHHPPTRKRTNLELEIVCLVIFCIGKWSLAV